MAKRPQVGDKVFCTYAATSWYTANKVYDVVAHPEFGHASVVASDGHYDMLSMCVSQFSILDESQTVLDRVGAVS